MKKPYLITWWMVIRHLRATAKWWVVWRWSIRDSTAAEAVACELLPKLRRLARCLGVKGSWVGRLRREKRGGEGLRGKWGHLVDGDKALEGDS
ncbi:hypothetical protein C1H46_041043 [Malus baccata]|uniref:Reverse transcriptase zinc-binding domain-containing protein n=1 Tax=Malus baccata TaxID=106549 RepID=A0A540KHD9_MALBA|nr:hypothetical protein C1H46_041043 [Malus baccata]